MKSKRKIGRKVRETEKENRRIPKGKRMVNITNSKSIFNAKLDNIFWFLFKNIAKRYWIKLMVLELKILYQLVEIKPEEAEKETVRSSGIEVAMPAILPIVFGFKFSVIASFLISTTNKYFEIATINNE